MTSFDRRGQGSPVVMVHGLGSRWQIFEPIIDLVAEDREVIAVDLPGFGAAPADPSVHPGPRGYATWSTEWLAGLGVDRPHIVGNSMGGGVALELGRLGLASQVTAFSPIGFYDTAGLRWTQGLLTALRAGGRGGEAVFGRALEHRVGRTVLLSTLFGRPSRVLPAAAQADVAALARSAVVRQCARQLRGLRPASRRGHRIALADSDDDRLGHP